MIGFERSDDYQPLFWVAGRPVHVTSLLVFLHLAALIVCSVLQGSGVSVLALAFSSDAVLHHWALWQPFTYAFTHLLGDLQDTITFLFEMGFLFVCGREVERYFGRKIFSILYLAMLLTAPVVLLTFASLSHHEVLYARSSLLHFGVFVAFATLLPGAQIYGYIASKWVAIALFVLLTAAFFSRGGYNDLLVLWNTSAVAYFGVRYASMGGEAFGLLANWRAYLPRRPARRELPARPRIKARRAVDTTEPAEPVGAVSSYRAFGDVHESIDPLLDKISKHGLASLTHSERATLERARVSLLRKDRGG